MLPTSSSRLVRLLLSCPGDVKQLDDRGYPDNERIGPYDLESLSYSHRIRERGKICTVRSKGICSLSTNHVEM